MHFVINIAFQDCLYCKKTFTLETNKNRHIRNIHGKMVRRFQCELCFRICRSLDSMKIHSKRSHGGFANGTIIWIEQEDDHEAFKLIGLKIEIIVPNWCMNTIRMTAKNSRGNDAEIKNGHIRNWNTHYKMLKLHEY